MHLMPIPHKSSVELLVVLVVLLLHHYQLGLLGLLVLLVQRESIQRCQETDLWLIELIQ